MTALQVELLETKLRVNNMAARMGINTRSVHVQTQARESAPDYATTLQNSNARWKLPICDTRRNFRRAETARVSAPDYMTTLRN